MTKDQIREKASMLAFEKCLPSSRFITLEQVLIEMAEWAIAECEAERAQEESDCRAMDAQEGYHYRGNKSDKEPSK